MLYEISWLVDQEIFCVNKRQQWWFCEWFPSAHKLCVRSGWAEILRHHEFKSKKIVCFEWGAPPFGSKRLKNDNWRYSKTRKRPNGSFFWPSLPLKNEELCNRYPLKCQKMWRFDSRLFPMKCSPSYNPMDHFEDDCSAIAYHNITKGTFSWRYC